MVALAAAPVSPLIAPLVGSDLPPPRPMISRIAVSLATATVLIYAALAARRAHAGRGDRREPWVTLAGTIVASGIAAHVLDAIRNSLFMPANLYVITTALLIPHAVGTWLHQRMQRRVSVATGAVRRVPADLAFTSALMQSAAWMMGGFWLALLLGLRYPAPFFLLGTGGLIVVTIALCIRGRVPSTG
jgi:hypothetical protein